MRDYQPPLIDIDPLLKLHIVENALGKIYKPSLDRKTIIAMIEEGTLLGHPVGPGNNYYVYKSSLDLFIIRSQEKLAA